MVHLHLRFLCSHMEDPPHSTQLYLTRLCLQIAFPPHSCTLCAAFRAHTRSHPYIEHIDISVFCGDKSLFPYRTFRTGFFGCDALCKDLSLHIWHKAQFAYHANTLGVLVFLEQAGEQAGKQVEKESSKQNISAVRTLKNHLDSFLV